MTLFDSHCHLQDDALFSDIENVIKRANDAGVKKMSVCISNPNEWSRACALQFDNLSLMFGIHPGLVLSDMSLFFSELEQILLSDSCAGIGETGLDFRKKFTNRTEQEESFAFHLDLARKLDRTVTVHCVHAWGRLIEIIEKHPAQRIVLHAFNGAVELIPKLEELNCYFSFGGAVTFERSKKARLAAAAVPLERLLIETDSPYFPLNGCVFPNEPKNLIHIAETIAGIRKCCVEKIANKSYKNAILTF